VRHPRQARRKKTLVLVLLFTSRFCYTLIL
jgi:hypothetical protein